MKKPFEVIWESPGRGLGGSFLIHAHQEQGAWREAQSILSRRYGDDFNILSVGAAA